MESELDLKEYKDGFNRGYWLFNYEPDVARLLIKSEVDRRDDFSTGFAEGLKQAEQEKTISEFDKLRSESNEQGQEIEL